MNNPKIYRTRGNPKDRHGESKDSKQPVKRVAARYPQESKLEVTIVHECINCDCELRSAITKAYKNMWVDVVNPSAVVYVICALKGSFFFRVEQEWGKKLDQGQFMLAVCDHVQPRAFIASPGEFHLVQISFPQAILDEMKPTFPWLNFATQEESRVNFGEWPPECITPVMLEVIYTLIRSPFDATKNIFFLRNIFREFLILMLRSVESKDEKGKDLPSNEIEIADKTHRLILQDIRRQPVIREIAKELGVGQSKLYRVFKHVFGFGIYQCLLAERMRLAKQILTETKKPLREIASLVGYKTDKTFFETYKRYYHRTPGSERNVARVQPGKRVKKARRVKTF